MHFKIIGLFYDWVKWNIPPRLLSVQFTGEEKQPPLQVPVI